MQVIDVYEPPKHLVLHHNHVAEGLSGALVGVITVKDPQLNTLSVELLDNHDSAFEVNPTMVVKYKLAARLCANKTPVLSVIDPLSLVFVLCHLNLTVVEICRVFMEVSQTAFYCKLPQRVEKLV